MSQDRIIESMLDDLEEITNLSKARKEDVEVIKLYNEASQYLLSHYWCNKIIDSWLAESWGFILGVFLFKIESDEKEVDDYVWVVTGDIPPAYIDILSATNSKEVIKCYVEIMTDWVDGVMNRNSIDDCYPVEVPPTKEFAEMLSGRLEIISEELSEN